MTKLAKGWLYGALACGFAAASGASATPTFSDIFTVYDPTGAVFEQVSIPDLDESPTNIVTLLTAPDPSQINNPTVLVEPHTGGQASDVFGVYLIGRTFFLGFQSDSDTAFVPFPAGATRTFTEAPDPSNPGYTVPYDATLYLAPALQAGGYTATFVSDFAVPEPATWALTLLGFGALGLAARSRRAAKA